MESNKRGTLVAAALLVAVLVCGGLGYRMLAARVEPEPAPIEQAEATDDAGEAPLLADHDATVYTVDGEAVTLTRIADGRPLVINFWATWCPYCVEELPDFQKIYAEYGERVSFAFVDVADGQRERAEDAAAWLVAQGYDDLPAYYDTSLEAVSAFGVTSYPTTVVVSGEGEILTVSPGKIDPALLRQALDSLVG